MNILFAGYFIFVTILGISCMFIDKKKAQMHKWRIREKTLFLIAILGGSLGIFAGMYLFRHKTKKMMFTIGIPVIIVAQVLLLIFLNLYQKEKTESPSAVVSRELSLIRDLDFDTIKSFITYESMPGSPSPAQVGPEAVEAFNLFFSHFEYQIHSEDIHEDEAVVTADIINIDTRKLATDLCRLLTSYSLGISSAHQPPISFNDYCLLLKDTLSSHAYELAMSSAVFHLEKKGHSWVIEADDTLQDQLVSGFISWMNDPYLLSPQEALSIYLNEFQSLSAEEWIQYLKIDDIFSTNSDMYASSIDHAYAEKIAEYFSWEIGEGTISDNTALIDLTITSIDLPQLLSTYKQKLLDYAHTTESIVSNESTISDTAAQYLLDTFLENSSPVDMSIKVQLTNDGRTWQPDISDDLTNAFLGNISQAMDAFQSE